MADEIHPLLTHGHFDHMGAAGAPLRLVTALASI